jgi:hypothetical protein
VADGAFGRGRPGPEQQYGDHGGQFLVGDLALLDADVHVGLLEVRIRLT